MPHILSIQLDSILCGIFSISDRVLLYNKRCIARYKLELRTLRIQVSSISRGIFNIQNYGRMYN